MGSSRTPRWCRRLIETCVPPGLSRDSLLGDLEEEMVARDRRHGPLRARFWHRLATLAVAFRYLRLRLAGRPRAIPFPDRESLMQSLRQDLVYGLRTLRNNPGTTLVLVVMLAVGIGPTVAAFTLAEAALLSPLPYPDAGRLVLGQTTFNDQPNPMGSAHDWADYRERSDVFEHLGAISGFSRPVTTVAGREADRAVEAYVSGDLFATLGVEPARGRNFAADELVPGGPGVVIVSHAYWQTRLQAAADVVGSTIRVGGSGHTVVGVMPAGFHFLWDTDLWRPLRLGEGYARARRFHNWLMVGRLRDGVDLERAQADVDAVSRQLQEEYPDSNENKALLLVGLADALSGPVRPQLLLLMATAALVLVVACANVASLLLARGATRETELAVRVALGADRRRIIRQLLTESLVLGLAAGAVGVALAVWLRGLLLEVVPLGLLGVESLQIGPGALLFALAASLVASVLFGLVPAFRVTPRSPAVQLGDTRTSTGGGHGFRSALVVAQVAMAVVLLVGAGLLVRSFARLVSQDPGFVTDRLLTAEVDLSASGYDTAETRLGFYRALGERIRALPGVEDVAFTSQLPIRDPGNNMAVRDADAPESDGAPLGYRRAVLPGYFSAMGMPLLAGRPLDDSDLTAGDVSVVVSRSLAEALFAGEPAVGRRVVLDWGEDVPGTVIGVVADARVNSLAIGGEAAYYYHYGRAPGSSIRMAIRTSGHPAGVAGSVREALRQLDPTVPLIETSSMEALIADSVSGARLLSVCMSVFSAVALLLAVIGLYGILAHAVARQRREIGLRLALGARSPDVIWMVVRRGMLLVLVGSVIGVALAFAAGGLVRQLLFQVGSADPATLVAVPVLLGAVGFLACLLPALRAMRVDPVISLRAE